MTSGRERIRIFDTTLCNGEHSPYGISYAQKLQLGRALVELGVDVIQAGFPGTSRVNSDEVAALARTLHGPVICALARCNRQDIELAAQTLNEAERPRIHVFLNATRANNGLPDTFNTVEEDILLMAVRGVRIARDICEDVEFSLENAARTNLRFLTEVFDATIEAGVTTINIPQVPGDMVPDEMTELIRYLRQNVRAIERVCLSVQCQNGFGLATANSLAAVIAGVRQIQCALGTSGLDSGNCSLEGFVRALTTREAFFNADTSIDTIRLSPTCRLGSGITGTPDRPIKRQFQGIFNEHNGM